MVWFKNRDIYLSTLFCLFCFEVLGENLGETITKERDNAFIKERALKELAKPYESLENTKKEKLIKEKNDANQCIKVKKINIINYDEKKQEKIDISNLSSITGIYLSCLSEEDLKRLLEDLNQNLINRGFVTSKAAISEYDKDKKILVIVIANGYVDKIEIFENQVRANKIKNKIIFSDKDDKLFNLYEAEQGLDQINRLKSSSATMRLEPSDMEMRSNLIIENNQKSKYRFSGSLANNGSETTGLYRRSLGLEIDDLIGLYDTTNFAYTDTHSSKAYNWGQEFVFKDYTIRYDGSSSKYNSEMSTFLTTCGDSETHNLNLEKMMFRNKNHKVNFGISFGLRRAKNIAQVNSNIIAQPIGRSRYMKFFVSDMYKSAKGVLFSRLEIIKSLNITNATWDRSKLRKKDAHFDFTKISPTFNYYKTFSSKYLYSATLEGSYSRYGLYGIDALNLSDNNYIRGYRSIVAQGEQGFALRQEVESRNNQNFRPYMFIDIGVVNSYREANTTRLLSSGIGLNYEIEFLRGNIVLAKGFYLRGPHTGKKKNGEIIFNLGMNF